MRFAVGRIGHLVLERSVTDADGRTVLV
jgi:hypothetical protein